MPAFIDLTGERFGALVVVSRAPNTRFRHTAWLCQCDCGAIVTPTAGHLRSGLSRSCGCTRFRHGERRSPEYDAWMSMNQRCSNPKCQSYDRYGARGITVCPRWRKSYEAFVADVGKRPSPDHTVERIDNDGDYEPGNVRWATPTEQARNRRSNHTVSYLGETMCLADWADRVGLPSGALIQRIAKGWTVERALTTPLRKDARHNKENDDA